MHDANAVRSWLMPELLAWIPRIARLCRQLGWSQWSEPLIELISTVPHRLSVTNETTSAGQDDLGEHACWCTPETHGYEAARCMSEPAEIGENTAVGMAGAGGAGQGAPGHRGGYPSRGRRADAR
jgi:hypothetical protein